MYKKATNSRELKTFWKEKIAHWQISGKTGAEWCREQGISYHSFTQWKKTFLVEANPIKIAEQFSELVDEPSKAEDSGIKVQCEELLLHVDIDFDGETLRRLILLLQRAFPC